MTETIFAAVFYGFMALGAFFTVFFLILMCMDEFGRGNK